MQKAVIWARSSAGRAPDPQSGGRRFDPGRVHHDRKITAKIGADFSFDHNNTTDGNNLTITLCLFFVCVMRLNRYNLQPANKMVYSD